MIIDYDENGPQSSFPFPVDAPVASARTGALWYVAFSEAWLPVILGCLLQLFQETTWNGNETQVQTAIAQAQDLMCMFQEGNGTVDIATVIWFAGDVPPAHYLVCDGRAVSRATYALLFGVIDVIYGSGDGSTTFNLPDLAGRSPVGAGEGSGLTLRSVGDKFGEENHQLITAEMPEHAHSDAGHTHLIVGEVPFLALTGEEPVSVPTGIPTPTGEGYASIQTTGGDGAHNNLQPSLALLPCIRYE